MPPILRRRRPDHGSGPHAALWEWDHPGYDPTPARPVRLIARDLAHDATLPAHQHRWHQVLYTATGVVRVSTADATWVVPPSRAIWIPTGTTHAVAILEEAHMRSLYVLPEAIGVPTDACRVIEVTHLLRELIADLGSARTGADTRRERLVSDLILDELRIAETLRVGIALPNDKRLAMLCNALIEDPASSRTLDEWAPLVGASARTLARLFADELDTTFAQWRQQMRLAHAAPLVARGWPLARVAAELGYSSQSAFSAMFKRSFGKSPSTFFAPKDAGP
jgi:AraC-like DNA-binding protein/quercetin dioxygenase-like cupin family protein